MPGEPRKFKAESVNSTAVHVEWKAPANKEKNGIIRGYQVHYLKVNEREEPIGSPLLFNVPGKYIPLSSFLKFIFSFLLVSPDANIFQNNINLSE